MSAPDLASMVQELCEPSKQRTRRPDGSADYVVSTPSLLDQLSSLEPSSGEGVRRGFGSRPPAQIEAIDLARTIDAEARDWARWLGISATGKPGTVIRRVYAQTPQMEDEVISELTGDVRRWWVGARILSGWDTPAWRPHNSCPVCGERGTIRVNVADRLGTCVDCGAAWDSSTLGVLAEHVRRENGEDDTPSAVA